MRLLLDTSRFLELRDPRTKSLDVLESAAEILLPFILVAEVESGARLSARGAIDAQLLERLRLQPRTAVVHSTDLTCRHYATLFAQLRRAGTPIPANDLWIAALALEHEATIYSADTHFSLLPKIPRLP